MSDFLSPEWFVEANSRLANTPVTDVEHTRHIVVTFTDGPRGGVHAFTLTVAADGATISEGDFVGADTILRLGYDDALALSSGALDSATALREGRLKVRGDVSSLLSLTSWLQGILPATGSEAD